MSKELEAALIKFLEAATRLLELGAKAAKRDLKGE